MPRLFLYLLVWLNRTCKWISLIILTFTQFFFPNSASQIILFCISFHGFVLPCIWKSEVSIMKYTKPLYISCNISFHLCQKNYFNFWIGELPKHLGPMKIKCLFHTVFVVLHYFFDLNSIHYVYSVSLSDLSLSKLVLDIFVVFLKRLITFSIHLNPYFYNH